MAKTNFREIVINQLDWQAERLEMHPDDYQSILDQAYGFILGVSYCCEQESEQENIGAIWMEWRRKHHPAYK